MAKQTYHMQFEQITSQLATIQFFFFFFESIYIIIYRLKKKYQKVRIIIEIITHCINKPSMEHVCRLASYVCRLANHPCTTPPPPKKKKTKNKEQAHAFRSKRGEISLVLE